MPGWIKNLRGEIDPRPYQALERLSSGMQLSDSDRSELLLSLSNKGK